MRRFLAKPLAISAGVFCVLLVWLSVGYFESFLDEEVQPHFFLKKHLSFQVKFYDMFATEADDKAFEALTADERKEYFEYCRSRFDTASDSNSALDACKNGTPPYLTR